MKFDYSKYIKSPGYKLPEGYDPSKYQKASFAVDIVVFSFDYPKLKLLLIRRKKEPFKDYWALPGGFVEMHEDPEESAKRELFEETSLKKVKLHQFGVFGHPKRDPRGRVISISYLVLLKGSGFKIRAGDDAREACWFPLSGLPPLAFDHKLILNVALERLRELCILKLIFFELLEERFQVKELNALLKEIFKKSVPKCLTEKELKKSRLIIPVKNGYYKANKKP